MSTHNPQPAAKIDQHEIKCADNPSETQQDEPLPQTSHLGCLLWPKVGFGDEAPYPRWLVTKSPESNGSNGFFKTESPSEKHSPVVSSSSSETKLGGGLRGLVWVFDAGPSSGWNKLDEDQLYEYAYKCLEDALGHPSSREHFRFAVANLFPTFTTNVSDSLPLMPTAPKTCYLGTQPGLREIIEAPTNLKQATYYFVKYSRPAMAVSLTRPGLHARESHLQIMATKMFHNMKGTLGLLRTENELDETSTIADYDSMGSQSTDQPSPCSENLLSSSPIANVEAPARTELAAQDYRFGLFSPTQIAKCYPNRGQCT